MENASKALLIAGSVLVAILLIAFGIRIFNSTKGTTESVQSTMSATEMATFNNKFAGYVGNNVNVAKIKSLVNVVIANNSTSSHKVKIKIGSTEYSDSTAMSNAVSTLESSKKYNVTPNYDGGIITLITITAAS